MILLYLCRPALKARSRFSWSPFYVENILILWLYPFTFHGISSERGSGAFHRSIPSKHPIRGAWEPGRTQNWLIDWVAGRHSWKSMTTGDDAMTTSLSTLFSPRQNLHANLTKTVSFRRLRFANTPSIAPTPSEHPHNSRPVRLLLSNGSAPIVSVWTLRLP